ncbi:MAG: SIR2 family protein, partial [Actinomycetota bacterium]|nr:SIR2 family protein [Actinomycetota bacterium]
MVDLEYLRRAQDQGLLVPFVGAGLGVGAGLPAWTGLLDRGLAYAIDEGRASPGDPPLDEARTAAASGRDDALLDAFELMRGVLDADPKRPSGFEAFLAEIFAEPGAGPGADALLRALHFIEPRRVITTNYDTLLEDFGLCGGLERSTTWQQPAEFRDVFRLGTGVVHLHGRWDITDSVILTRSSYDRIGLDERARQIAQAVFHSGVLLFVGTSLDGTHDPHLRVLLEEFRLLAGDGRVERSPHVMLVKGRSSGEDRARLRAQGIEPLSYGDSYGDLPGFLRSIGTSSQIQIRPRAVASVLAGVRGAASLSDALQRIGRWIEDDIFDGRNVRVAFSRPNDAGTELRQFAVRPADSSGNPHNYPLSIAAWALVEGRILQWPADRERRVDGAWLNQTRKHDRIRAHIEAAHTGDSPEIAKYVDVPKVQRRFGAGELALGDFYQEWETQQPRTPYRQFISVPVPMLDKAGNRDDPPEHGVFNIDTLERPPLVDRSTEELLRLASATAALAFA